MNKTVLSILFLKLLFALQAFGQTEVLVWSDEFNGTGAPNPANWGYDIGNNGWGNNEVQNYTSLTTNSRQENGNLVIQAIKSMNGNWSSARLISKNKAEFKYGRIVFRAKLPTGSGTWPALWLLGEDISTNGWPACGEIDVMEHVGKTMGIIHHAIHTPSSYGNTVNKKQTTIANVASEFHDYQLNWTPQKLEFSIDGFVTYVYSPVVKTNANWPFNKELFLIVNIAMGGNFGSDPQYETGGLKNGIDPSLSSATMLVDWIRVYQIVSPTNEPIASENWPEGLKILPNPSFGPLSVKLPIQDSTAYFLLSDLSGKVVLEKTLPHQENALDVSTLPKGNYIAQIFTQNQVYVGKVILQ